MLHVGTETADAGDDRLAILGMLADFARKRQQAERTLQIDVVGRNTFRQARTLGFFLLVLAGLAELQVGAETAAANRDFEAALRIFAKFAHAVAGGAVGSDREGPGVAAFGVVGAADEATKFAE